ncbi:DNA methyltransferase [Streptomyces sp. 8N114]|uniref:DNA methyltransferase n=1 Tax=Streptomyces sp. 8N114 TaxID=3457419 RepID=UPI003FD2CC54
MACRNRGYRRGLTPEPHEPWPPRLAHSVWNTAPTSAPHQRRARRYVPGSAAHPAKMLSALAAHAIATYSQPGGTVLDPMCGIGTTLVGAQHLGRHAIGIEHEPRRAHLAAPTPPLPCTVALPALARSSAPTPVTSPL